VTTRHRVALAAGLAIPCLLGAGWLVSQRQPQTGVLMVRVGLGGKGSDWSRVLVASRDGRIGADLPAGRYTIAFTWDGAGILSTRGWRPFAITSGRQTRISPIAPVPYALSIDPAA
jgi:hypothetical protein